MLEDKDILEVANLAKLNIEDMGLFKKELNALLECVNKINELDLDINDIMISPTDNKDKYFNDLSGNSIDINDIKINAPKAVGNYIEVGGSSD